MTCNQGSVSSWWGFSFAPRPCHQVGSKRQAPLCQVGKHSRCTKPSMRFSQACIEDVSSESQHSLHGSVWYGALGPLCPEHTPQVPSVGIRPAPLPSSQALHSAGISQPSALLPFWSEAGAAVGSPEHGDHGKSRIPSAVLSVIPGCLARAARLREALFQTDILKAIGRRKY